MPRRMLQLAGTAEIAELLGVTRQRAYQLSTAKGFPEPVAVIGTGERPRPLWRYEDVLKWATERSKRLGIPLG